MTNFLFDILINLVAVAQFFVFLAVVLSYFPNSRGHPFVLFVLRATQPIFRLFPKIRIGMFDFSPLLVLLTLQFLGSFLLSVRGNF